MGALVIRALVLLALVMPGTASAGEPTVEVVTLTAQPAIARIVHAKPDVLGTRIAGAVLSLVAAADNHQLAIVGPPFARYLSRGATLEVEVGVPVRKRPTKPLGKGVHAIELPAGPAAVVMFRGPHDQLPRAHAALDAWLSSHHKRPAGPRWESYLTNPIETPDPAAQQTRIIAPLANQRACRASSLQRQRVPEPWRVRRVARQREARRGRQRSGWGRLGGCNYRGGCGPARTLPSSARAPTVLRQAPGRRPSATQPTSRRA